MARPHKPNWNSPGPGRPGRFRCMIDGKMEYFPKSIGQHDRPQIGGIPKSAWEYLHALLKAREGRASAVSDPTVHWMVELYLQWSEREAAEGRLSVGQYRAHCVHLALWQDLGGCGDVRVRDLGVELMDDFFATLRASRGPSGSPYSAHYVANVGKSIRAALNWSARPVSGRVPSRLLGENPLRGYRFPRPPGAVRGYVEGAVVRRFLRWAWARSRAYPDGHLMRRFDRLFVLMLRFQRLTGCRPGEACDLRWSDIDWTAGKATIPPERHKAGKKTRKARVIFLTPRAVRLLRTIERLDGRHREFVFTHRRGNHATDRGQGSSWAGEPWPGGSAASAKVTDWRKRALAEGLAGLEGVGPRKLVAYVNRHGYVSEAISLGLSHEQAAELVGNTRDVIASTYAHSIEDAAARRALDLDERRRGRSRRG